VEARKLAPDAPEIYFNLGLAESKIPGRELRAIAWFGAYLAANPSAPNASAIKQQIMTLDVANQSTIARLLRTSQDATDRVSGQYHVEGLKAVAARWADFGDFTAALNTVKLMTPGPRDYDPNVWNELSMQGSTMTIKQAVEKHVRDYRDFALRDIALAQAEARDFKNARRTIELMVYSESKTRSLMALGESELKAGDKAGALKTLRQARDTAGRIGRESGIGLMDSTYIMKQLQERIAAAETEIHAAQAASPADPIPPVQASDWLRRLDETAEDGTCPLNTEPFLNLPAYLESASPDNPGAIASNLGRAATALVRARKDISNLLKAQGVR
jgi:tetratricopeptide (TPR) repeat protein